MKRYSWLLFIVLALTAVNAAAQRMEYVFKNFTQEEGLPSNETYYVFEDSKHYIWIATDLGVVRYNGNKFELFDLPDNVVFRIKEDKKGRIWFFTHKALLAYFENERMIPFAYNDKIAKRIDKIQIKDAFVDDNDNIHLASTLDSNYIISASGEIASELCLIKRITIADSFKITHLDGNACFTKKIRTNIFNSDTLSFTVDFPGFSSNYSFPLVHHPIGHFGSMFYKNALYFFGDKVLLKLSRDGSVAYREMPSLIISMTSANNKICVGLIKGGAVFFNEDLSLNVDKPVLPNKSVTCVLTDFEGGIWLSTLEDGVFYIKNKNIHHFSDIESSNPFIFSLFNTGDSALLYTKSNGFFRYSNDQSALLFPQESMTTHNIFLGERNTIFGFGGVIIFSGINKLNNSLFDYSYLVNSTSEAARIGKDTFCYSRSNNIVLYKSSFLNFEHPEVNFDYNCILNPKNLLNKPGKVFRDSRNILWAGTNDGLYRAAAPYDTLLKWQPASRLLNKGVNIIREIPNGYLVAGVRQSGIALLKDTGIVYVITEKDGLLSNKVRYLLSYKKQLWAATAKGISIITFTSYSPLVFSITNISKNDGFYNLTINQLVPYKNSIAAATSNGIYFIENPEDFLYKKLPDIPFYINSISTYRGDTVGINKVRLPYSKNRIIIKYSAVSFNSFETVRYLYRFDQSDTVWHSTSNTELLLENLEPGTYNLQIKASIPNQQRSSPTTSLVITIDKPWWQNNWLRLALVMLTGSGVYLYVTRRVRKIKKEEQKKTALSTKLAELEQTALRSQMNPHFIFNCLTSIQQLIVSGNKVDANEYLVKFARLIRKTLELSAQPFISIREETEYLTDYLFLEQLRLSGHFQYKIAIAQNINADKIQIPNMMIQPVAENCIRHGIKSLPHHKGFIDIDFKINDEAVICTITDNGVGRTESSSLNMNDFTKHKSYGVDIVRRRLSGFAETEKSRTGVEIKDLVKKDGTSAGTQVVLQLPYKNAE